MPRGEGIKPLSNLFEKYKKTLRAPQGSVVKVFCEVVEELYGWQIAREKVSYTPATKVLGVAVSGPLKTELKLKQTEILAHLKGRLGSDSAPKEIL